MDRNTEHRMKERIAWYVGKLEGLAFYCRLVFRNGHRLHAAEDAFAFSHREKMRTIPMARKSLRADLCDA
jgi:hypothetical protein